MADANDAQQQPQPQQQPPGAQAQQQQPNLGNLPLPLGVDPATVAAIAQAIVMALQQQPVAAPAQVAALQPVAFALTSGQAITGRIDFASKAGQNIEKKCLRGAETKFDGTATSSETFRQGYIKYAADMHLRNTIHASITQPDGSVLNVLDHAPQLTEQQIRVAAEPYMSGADQQTRTAQDNKLSVDFLMATLTNEFRLTIQSNEGSYTYAVPDPNNPGTETKVECAALLFKAIMDVANLNCAASLRTAKTRLESSPKIMKDECDGGNITQYNKLFDTTYNEIKQMGSKYDTNDLVHYYMSGLSSTSCEVFNAAQSARLAQWQEQDHHLAIGPQGQMVECDYATLKSLGQKHYNHLQQTNKWTSTSKEAQIIALSAELNALKLKGGLQSDSVQYSGTHSKGVRNKKNTSNKSRQKEEEIWRRTAPKPGEPTTKLLNGRPLNWCPHHQAWGAHEPDECRVGIEQREASTNAHKVQHVANAATYAEVTATLEALADLNRD